MNSRGALRGPPVGRHAGAVFLTATVMLLFIWLEVPHDREGPPYVSHALLADVSLVLLCLVLVLGPGARFVARLRPLVPWGRELGMAMFVTAALHVALLLEPDLDLIGFFGERNFRGEMEWGLHMWHASNWVGVVALGYALVLAVTSNDLSQRWLGRGWKFVQRQAYALFVLTWLHTAAFLLLDAGHGSSFQTWFLAFTLMATVAQFAGFAHTIRSSRGPSPYRVPARPDPADFADSTVGVAKWAGVLALWTVMIAGSWVLATAESAEDKARARFCERYEEVGELSRVQQLEVLAQYLPTDDPPITASEMIRDCRTS